MKHASGPWRISNDPLGICHVIISGKSIDVHNDLANARLIAAAPDLLEACKNSLAFMRAMISCDDSKYPLTTSALRQAIAKAEGEK